MSKTLHTHVVKKHSFVDDNKHIYAHAMFVTQWYEDRENGLKKVNDTYGHEYGDALIQNGAAILKKVWGNKFLYRIGGDEFAIVRFGMNEEKAQEMMLLFEKTIADFNCQHNGEESYLQMAIGMATYNPEIDKGYMEVFRRADSAMYEDKKRKKNKEGSQCQR